MTVFEIVIITLFFISTFLLIFIWSIYIRYRLTIKHPNSIFFIVVTIQILEMLLIITIFFSLGSLPSYSKITGPIAIQVLGYLLRFTKIYASHYIATINIEIFVRLRKSLLFEHKKRMIFYYTYNTLASFIFTIFGRGRGDNLLGYFRVMRIFYEIYILLISVTIVCLIFYFYLKFKTKMQTKDMTSLTILSLITVFLIFLQIVIDFLSNENLSSNKIINQLSYFLNSMEGILEFFVFCMSKRFKEYMKESISIIFFKPSSKNIERSNSLPLVQKNPIEYRLSEGNLGFFGDVFESLTTNTLIKILVATTLRFSYNDTLLVDTPKFEFNSNDVLDLHTVTQLDFLKSSNYQIVNPKDFKLTELNYELFSKIREKYLRTNIYSSLIKVSNYYKMINLISEKGGRSNAFIFVTTDQKLVIKTINKHEYTIFKDRLLHNYVSRILNYEESKLVKIYAVLHLEKIDQYVIIMENLIYRKEESFVFDLKGSKVGRIVKDIENPLSPPKGIVLKDLNFSEFGFKVKLDSETREKVLKILIQDFCILKDSGIMDYSVILGIRKGEKNVDDNRGSFVDLDGFLVSIGIIDMFQEYNIKKIGENAVKSLFSNPQEVSSIDPEQYFQRISDFISTIFL